VGTPPEGRHSRDRARPDFWRQQRFLSVGGAMLVIIVIAVVVIAAVR
jgi:hypothetical protein